MGGNGEFCETARETHQDDAYEHSHYRIQEAEGSSDITEEKTRESEADTLFRIEKICRDITEETPNLSEDELARRIIERFTLSAEGSHIRTRWGIDGLDNCVKLLAEQLIEVPKKESKKKKKKAEGSEGRFRVGLMT